MRLPDALRRFFGSKKSAGYPGTWIPISGGADGVNEANLLEANREWVFIATHKNADAVASIRFKVMRYTRKNDDEEVFNGPLVDFLESPGKGFTGKDFIYLNTAYKELTGNAFWELVDKRSVAPLIPTRVSPIIRSRELIGFKYADGEIQRTIPTDKVLHDRYIDPARPYWGKGKLHRISRWVDTGTYLTEFLNRFFENGATFGGFLETEEESEERINLIKVGLKNDHIGVDNAHKIGVLPKGTKYAKTTANMAELQMGETDDRQRDKILAGFGVPKTLVGLTTEVNRASAEASEYIYAKYTVKPIADDLVEFLNVNVAPLLDPSGEYYFAYDDFVPHNMELKIKEREGALGKQPYLTVNEVRAQVGLPAVPGGDVVYGNPMMLPIGESPPAPAPNNPEDDDKPQKRIPARARAIESRSRLVEDILERAVEVSSSTRTDPDAESHKHFVSRVHQYQDLVANKVRAFNNRQERDVVQRLKQITKAVKKGDVFDMDGEVSLLIDFVSPLLSGLMLEQALEEYKAQAFPGQFDENEPRIKRVVDIAAKRLARSYNATTAKLLAATLNEGIDEGNDLTQLVERVKMVYAFSDAFRAIQVAQTETFYIANEGSREAYRQSGVVQSMRWYTGEDERVCEFCGPQHGKVIGVSEVFFPKDATVTGAAGNTMTTDYRAIDVPPLHPLCRCFIRPERIDIG